MTPYRSSVPDDRGPLDRPEVDRSMSWGARQSASEHELRAGSRPSGGDGLVRCPSCDGAQTTVVQSADRGPASSIRRDNPGYRCFGCGTGWTVTIGEDHDPDGW